MQSWGGGPLRSRKLRTDYLAREVNPKVEGALLRGNSSLQCWVDSILTSSLSPQVTEDIDVQLLSQKNNR